MKLTTKVQNCNEYKSSNIDVENIARWIRTNSIPLDTVKFNSGFKDMEPLKELLALSKIVALGEATHGTREFFQVKHRMLEFLVNNLDFHLFGIEASLPDTMTVNEYVLNGKGNPAEAVGSMLFWTWNTEEVLDLVNWMREYNKDPSNKKKLKFYGFDMQHTKTPIDKLKSFFKKVDLDFYYRFDEVMKPFLNDSGKQHNYYKLPDNIKKEVVKEIKATIQHLKLNRKRFIKKTSIDDFVFIFRYAIIIKQAEEMYAAWKNGEIMELSDSLRIRDKYMADNVRWILNHEGPNSKIVLWAHNEHISSKGLGQGVPSMGSYLKEFYGDKYVNFGFSFSSGSFQALKTDPYEKEFLKRYKGLQKHTVGLAPKGNIGWYMHQAGIPLFILNLHKPSDIKAVDKWIKHPHPMRYIGGAFNEKIEKEFKEIILPDQFDFLIHIDKTTSARILPTGPQGFGTIKK